MPKPNRGLQIKARTDRPGTWEVGEYVQGKWKRHRSGLGSAEEAQIARYEIERENRVGKIHEISDRLIGDTIADYLEERGDLVQSKDTLAIAVKNLLAFFGGRPWSYVTEDTCNRYYVFRNERHRKRQTAWNKKHKKNYPVKNISNSTVGRELRQLRAMFQRDLDMRRMNVPVKIWIKSEHNKRAIIPSRREVICMARKSKIGSNKRKYTLMAFYTAQRKSAVLQLKWPQVTSDIIDFNPPGTPQSNKRRPVIPMNRKLKSFMRIWRKRGMPSGPVLHRSHKPIKDIKDIPTSLRHAATVQMLISGVPITLVAQYVGNSEEVLRKHYGHLIPAHLLAAAEALG